MVDYDIVEMTNEDGLINKRYRINKKIGEGSYGVVYKAEDTKNNNNFVAIKQVSKLRLGGNKYLIDALKKELEIMHLIDHENSVRLIDDFENEDKYSMVMELCDTDLDLELKKLMKEKKRPFNEVEVHEIMIQFNKVFSKLREEHIIHRDLKLKNILVKYDKDIPILGFIIKLSDFGFSKVMNEEDLTCTNLGSPATKAPEVMFGNEYGPKADLWSIGVIIFQLLFNRLPFPAKNVRELKEVIMNSEGVKLPEPNDYPITHTCFDLLNNLLRKEPSKRIEFENYFNHSFFSEKHKKELLSSMDSSISTEKKIEGELKNNNKPKENNEDKNKDMNKRENEKIDKKKEGEDDNNENEEFNNRFTGIRKLSEDFKEFSIFKAKDQKRDKFVYIKEISRSVIDSNERNTKIFKKEIELLTKLKGKKFPEFIGLFVTSTHYNIVIEYYSGMILDNFLQNRHKLDEFLVSEILKQLKPSLSKLNDEKIVLEFLSPKSFAFSFYNSDSNFEIKFFDYGLHSIFLTKNQINSYLLFEAELGEIVEQKTNILGFGLTVYKMLFGEDAFKFNGDEINDEKIKKKREFRFKGKVSDCCKNFLKNTIDGSKRVDWDSLLFDDFFTRKFVQKIRTDDMEKEPLIKDEQIEYMMELVLKKINFIINYFKKLLNDKDRLLDLEIYLSFYNEIKIFLLLSILECKTIKMLIQANADTDKTKIEPSNQEIHLLKIKLNQDEEEGEDNNSINKYDYSYINFVNKNDEKGNKNNNNIIFYNKENPSFEKYKKNFYEFETELRNIFIEINNKNDSGNNSTGSGSGGSGGNGGNDSNSIGITNNLTNKNNNNYNYNNNSFEQEMIEIQGEKELRLNGFHRGNIEKLYTQCFKNSFIFYSNKEYEKAIDELILTKYLSELIIFIRLILGEKKETKSFEKLLSNLIEDNQSTTLVTFIGGKIANLEQLNVFTFRHNSSSNIQYDEDKKIENIKAYDILIDFYPKILKFMDEINKEKI